MKLIVGADHRGFGLKQQLKGWLENIGHDVEDVGAVELIADDDEVDYTREVVIRLESGGARGILFCGSGNGTSMAANRYRGIRSIVGFNQEIVKQGREHQDANVLCIPADWVSLEEAQVMVDTFLNTTFSGKERYVRRLHKLDKLGQ